MRLSSGQRRSGNKTRAPNVQTRSTRATTSDPLVSATSSRWRCFCSVRANHRCAAKTSLRKALLAYRVEREVCHGNRTMRDKCGQTTQTVFLASRVRRSRLETKLPTALRRATNRGSRRNEKKKRGDRDFWIRRAKTRVSREIFRKIVAAICFPDGRICTLDYKSIKCSPARGYCRCRRLTAGIFISSVTHGEFGSTAFVQSERYSGDLSSEKSIPHSHLLWTTAFSFFFPFSLSLFLSMSRTVSRLRCLQRCCSQGYFTGIVGIYSKDKKERVMCLLYNKQSIAKQREKYNYLRARTSSFFSRGRTSVPFMTAHAR